MFACKTFYNNTIFHNNTAAMIFLQRLVFIPVLRVPVERNISDDYKNLWEMVGRVNSNMQQLRSLPTHHQPSTATSRTAALAGAMRKLLAAGCEAVRLVMSYPRWSKTMQIIIVLITMLLKTGNPHLFFIIANEI